MLINTGYSSALTQSVSYKPYELRQNVADSRKDVADNVTISEAGKSLSENTFENSRILQAAKSNEKLARQLLDGFTNGLDSPLVDISNLDPRTGKGVVYSTTGLPVTKESERLFDSVTARLKSEKNSLVQSEKEKGTPVAEILEKVFSLIDQQSDEYKAQINWNKISS